MCFFNLNDVVGLHYFLIVCIDFFISLHCGCSQNVKPFNSK